MSFLFKALYQVLITLNGTDVPDRNVAEPYQSSDIFGYLATHEHGRKLHSVWFHLQQPWRTDSISPSIVLNRVGVVSLLIEFLIGPSHEELRDIQFLNSEFNFPYFGYCKRLRFCNRSWSLPFF